MSSVKKFKLIKMTEKIKIKIKMKIKNKNKYNSRSKIKIRKIRPHYFRDFSLS